MAILHDIRHENYRLSTSFNYPPSEMACLLQSLSQGHLITLMENQPCDSPESYRLACEYHKISLLSILETLGEGVYFNHPSDENFYSRYGTTARKLGVVNQMTRSYLEEISIAEIPQI